MRFIVKIFLSIKSLIVVLIKHELGSVNKLNQQNNENRTVKILGNGKSLNENLASMLKDQTDYMVVNRHVLSDSYGQLKPKYYVLADPHFFKNEEGINILNKIKELTNWELYLVIAYSLENKKKVLEIFNHHQNIHIQFFNATPFNGFDSIKFSLYNLNLSMPRPQNVMVAAIYTAICSKYSTIELYGVEHSWIHYLSVNIKNEVCLENPHFYDRDKPQIQTWEQIQHSKAKLHEVLTAYSRMFESYHELATFADRKGIEILNCTPNSYIDAFKRKNNH